jgi:hypothetical protein
VGGTGRSGTTVTSEVFALRRDVVWPQEARFITDPDGIIDFYITFSSDSWSPTMYSMKVRRLARLLRACGSRTYVEAALVYGLRILGLTKRLPYIIVPAYGEVHLERVCPGYGGHVRKLLDDLVAFSFAARWCGSQLFEPASLLYRAPFGQDELRQVLGSFIRDILHGMAAASHAKAVVEDSPWNFLFFDKILELVPEARLVHVYRDPRDVVASFRTQQWAPSNPVQGAHWYCGLMQQWRRIRERLPRDSYIEISLEDLVTSREPVVRRIAGFWGLEWDDAVLAADLSRSHMGRWKRDLSEADQHAICEILGPELTALGYV